MTSPQRVRLSTYFAGDRVRSPRGTRRAMVTAGLACACLTMAAVPARGETATAGDLIVSTTTTAVLDTGSGTLWADGQSIPVTSTVLSAPGGSYRVFDFGSVRVDAGATLKVVGPHPVLIHASGDISIVGTLDGDGQETQPGAGGGAGGTITHNGAGGGRGASGGGGGAFVVGVVGLYGQHGESSGGWLGGMGGIPLSGVCGGGPGQTAGPRAWPGLCLGPGGEERGSGGGGGGGYVDADGIVRGGSGGGSGTDSAGGGGGAGIALRSDTLVSVAGRVSVGGGRGAYVPDLAYGGGGGGGGGGVGISAPTVTVTGRVSAGGGPSAPLFGGSGATVSGGDGAAGVTRVQAVCLTGSDRFYPAVQFTRTGPAPLIDDSFVTDENEALTVPAPGVLANDCGAAGATVSAAPTHGSVTIGTDGGFTYQPSAGYAGTDVFQYAATPAGGTASQATVTITVRPVTPPAGTLTAQVAQPINADGSSTFSVKRGVVPVKFTLSSGGAPTCDLPDAALRLTHLGATDSGVIDESTYLSPADTGSAFRVADCQYVYNLSVKALTAGGYRAEVLIAGNSVGSARFELK